MKLKTDLHIHVRGDPEDTIPYTPFELIDKAAGYDVLAFTCHNKVLYSTELAAYAQSKGIVLIPAVEKTLEGKHVLIYNVDNDTIQKIDTFDKLRELKREKNILVIAAHPFYPTNFCLKGAVEKYIEVFDAIEYAHFHVHGMNYYNNKAAAIAKKYNKPMVGNSDSHRWTQFGTTYSLVEGKKTIDGVFSAIRHGKVQVISPPLPFLKFFKISLWIVRSLLRHKLKEAMSCPCRNEPHKPV